MDAIGRAPAGEGGRGRAFFILSQDCTEVTTPMVPATTKP